MATSEYLQFSRLCSLYLCAFVLSVCAHEEGSLSKELAVEIDGDHKLADQLAKIYGFLNLGQVLE